MSETTEPAPEQEQQPPAPMDPLGLQQNRPDPADMLSDALARIAQQSNEIHTLNDQLIFARGQSRKLIRERDALAARVAELESKRKTPQDRKPPAKAPAKAPRKGRQPVGG